ncbi:MAG: tRNA (adenosine(37)-N6)-dimethylallyltransferase MiaA [Flavobacteriaceae bacterium]|nr:tRNA (adenosine(37)-N6)-dimethylallyltransferase MiaA [Flavobacteriaceae bacterium]
MSKNNLIYIGGPTGVGKSIVAIEVAKYFSTEIISCDSRQFYKEMSIGTAVPNKKQLNEVKHYFIQDRSVKNPLTVGKYQIEALNVINELFKKHKNVILVGGSGLYANSILFGLDKIPNVSSKTLNEVNYLYKDKGLKYITNLLRNYDFNYYNKVDLNNHRRIIRALSVCIECKKPYSSFLGKENQKKNYSNHIYILNQDRKLLYERINNRVDLMVNTGLEVEAKTLSSMKSLKPLNTVGYREWFNDNNQKNKKFVVEEIKKNSRRYAKRQITWFKKYKSAIWIEPKKSINYIIQNHK